MVPAVVKKTSMGHQKKNIVKIPKKINLQVTFSKRRSGLFKKASELCTLCGAKIAIVVFSPARKAYSFGHPNVESIIDRYLTRSPPPNFGALNLIEAQRNACVFELNSQLTQVLNQLAAEKMHGAALTQMRKASQSQHWWEAAIDQLGLHELEHLRDSMEELKEKVTIQANNFLIATPNSLPFSEMNGIEIVDPFENNPVGINWTSTIPCAYSFGYGPGHF